MSLSVLPRQNVAGKKQAHASVSYCRKHGLALYYLHLQNIYKFCQHDFLCTVIDAVFRRTHPIWSAAFKASVTPSFFALAEVMVFIRPLQAWSISARCLNSVPLLHGKSAGLQYNISNHHFHSFSILFHFFKNTCSSMIENTTGSIKLCILSIVS